MGLLDFISGGPKKPEGFVVLHVDDSSTILKTARIALEYNLGYTLLQAVDGESALKVAARNLPDVILLDITLPGIDGFSVLENVRKTPALKDTIILMCSAHDEPGIVDKSLKLGANGFIMKSGLSKAEVMKKKIMEALKAAGKDPAVAEGKPQAAKAPDAAAAKPAAPPAATPTSAQPAAAPAASKPVATPTPTPTQPAATPVASKPAATPAPTPTQSVIPPVVNKPVTAMPTPAITPKPIQPAAMPMPILPTAAPTPTAQPAPRTCKLCNGALTYIEPYKAWYCYGCKKYPDIEAAASTQPARACRLCNGALTYIEPYKAWYCYGCKKYPDIEAAAPAQQESRPCRLCNGSLSYIEQYKAWYCYSCQKYPDNA